MKKKDKRNARFSKELKARANRQRVSSGKGRAKSVKGGKPKMTSPNYVKRPAFGGEGKEGKGKLPQTKKQAAIFQKHHQRLSIGDASGMTDYLTSKDMKRLKKTKLKRPQSLSVNPY